MVSYVPARFVVMRDPGLAEANPAMAIHDTTTGGIWRDTGSKLAWINPAAPGVADYALGLSKELSGLGFDEVQFDYIRFPTDGILKRADFGNGIHGDFYTTIPTRKLMISVLKPLKKSFRLPTIILKTLILSCHWTCLV